MNSFHKDFDKDFVIDIRANKFDTLEEDYTYIIDEETDRVLRDWRDGGEEERARPLELEKKFPFIHVLEWPPGARWVTFTQDGNGVGEPRCKCEGCDLYSVNLDEFIVWSVEQELNQEF